MKKIILKIQEGDLFRFFDSEDKDSFTLGAKRTADICIRQPFFPPVAVRFVRKNDVWYAEDAAGEDSKYRRLLNGTPFRRPDVKMDGTISICRTDIKKEPEAVRITAVRQIRRKKASAFDLTAKTVTTVGKGGKTATSAWTTRSFRKSIFSSCSTAKTALSRTRTAWAAPM